MRWLSFHTATTARTGAEPEEQAPGQQRALVGERGEDAAHDEEGVVEEEGLAPAQVVIGVGREEPAEHGPEDRHGRRQLLFLCRMVDGVRGMRAMKNGAQRDEGDLDRQTD